jgi:hypothetical protein
MVSSLVTGCPSQYVHGMEASGSRWLPALICNPLGLGLFGASLQYHWSWGVLAFAQILVTFGSLSITPITVK